MGHPTGVKLAVIGGSGSTRFRARSPQAGEANYPERGKAESKGGQINLAQCTHDLAENS